MPTDSRPSIVAHVQVMYFDTDAAAVVHNLAYLRFIETARTLLAIQMGMSFEHIARTQIHPVLTRTDIRYRRPGRLGDELEIRGRLGDVSAARFHVDFEVVRPADGAVLATCQQELALIQLPEGKVIRLPAGFANGFGVDSSR